MRAWAATLLAVLVACGLIGAFIAPEVPNTGFKDAASVLAFVSLAAVAIERSIEGGFSAMSGRFGEWWPLRAVRAEFDTFEASTNRVLGPVTKDTLDQLAAAKQVALAAGADVASIQGLIDGVTREQARLAQQLDDVQKKLPPGSARLARLGEINTAMATTLHDAHQLSAQATTGAQAALREASDLAERASLIISSFGDNPARRMAALLLGASLGMLIAAGIGLNLFAATLAPPAGAADLAGLLAGKVGVVLTGIVIGLGSAPTHEVVKSLQAYKEARSGSVAVPTMTTGSSPSPQVVDEAAIPGGFGASASSGTTAVYRVSNVRRSS
jgi:hypothetical protein